MMLDDGRKMFIALYGTPDAFFRALKENPDAMRAEWYKFVESLYEQGRITSVQRKRWKFPFDQQMNTQKGNSNMKITVINNDEILFSKITPGTVFKTYGGNYAIKAENGMATRLDTGAIITPHGNERVRPVECELIIHGNK